MSASDRALFDAIRRVKGSSLTQAEVDDINAALHAGPAEAVLDPALFAAVVKHLSFEEGRVSSAYQDHLGFWTIGVGRLIDKRKGGGLSDPEIDFMLANDVLKVVAAMKDWPAWKRVQNDPVRATALISMCFQLGAAGLATFKQSLQAIAQGAWISAGMSLANSLWAKQTPARAKRIISMIQTGELA